MSISGTSFRDVLTATGGGSTVTLKDEAGIAITATGPNCQSFGATAQCSGVSTISFSGDAGNDVFNNNTSRRSTLNGGSGTDVLLGGSGDDSLFGGSGTADRAFGGAGSDLCIAEFEKDCER
jgi:serralysin